MADRCDSRIAALAESQHGVVTRVQLFELGLSRGAVVDRVRRGALRRLHPGIYAPGHAALRDDGRRLGAVLACGPHAVLSHLSAARLWGMRVPGVELVIDVTAPTHRRGACGIATHRTRRLDLADVTVERGVPVTTVARTLIDVADVVPYRVLRTIADRGVRLDASALRRALARAPRRPGSARIRRLIGDDDELRTRSRPERRLLAVCRAAGLPVPLVNHRVAGHERDAVWPLQRVVVEVDGHAIHAPRAAREDDHARDTQLMLAGWRVTRFTDAELDEEPQLVAGRLAALLGAVRGT